MKSNELLTSAHCWSAESLQSACSSCGSSWPFNQPSLPPREEAEARGRCASQEGVRSSALSQTASRGRGSTAGHSEWGGKAFKIKQNQINLKTFCFLIFFPSIWVPIVPHLSQSPMLLSIHRNGPVARWPGRSRILERDAASPSRIVSSFTRP